MENVTKENLESLIDFQADKISEKNRFLRNAFKKSNPQLWHKDGSILGDSLILYTKFNQFITELDDMGQCAPFIA